MAESPVQIECDAEGDGWAISVRSLPNAGFARALGQWVNEAFGAEAGVDGLTLNVRTSAREPVERALEAIRDELATSTDPYEALGDVARRVALGEPLVPPSSGKDGTPFEPLAERSDASPLGDETSGPRARLEAIGSEGAAAETEPSPLEPIGDSRPVESLPLASDPRAFDIELTSAGADRGRTTALLAAALDLDLDAAIALVDNAPSTIARRVDARVVRRVNTILTAARGSTIAAAPSDGESPAR